MNVGIIGTVRGDLPKCGEWWRENFPVIWLFVGAGRFTQQEFCLCLVSVSHPPLGSRSLHASSAVQVDCAW